MNIYLLLTHVAQQIDGSTIDLPNKGINPGSDAALSSTVQVVLQIVFGTLAALAVLVIAIAGLQYVLSAGDAQKIAKAKDAIIYALVGLVVAILAFSIVSFVLDGFFG